MDVAGGRTQRDAALNNAEWCEAVARSHGVRSRFTAAAWLAASRTPVGYPDAVTLVPEADRSLLDGIDTSPGCSVKDSFGTLDLARDGFDVLFESTWIVRAVAAEGSGAGPRMTPAERRLDWRWSRVTRHGLEEWAELSRARGVYRASLLAEPGVVLLQAHDGSRTVGGAALTHTGRVVGISNVFAVAGVPIEFVWEQLAAQTELAFPGRLQVGYESGADLMAPLGAGFRELGPLRVWIRR
jgi:hypothetical protein